MRDRRRTKVRAREDAVLKIFWEKRGFAPDTAYKGVDGEISPPRPFSF